MTMLPNEGLLQQFYVSCCDPLIFTDEQSTIHFVNPAALEFFGYAHDELIGQSIKLLIPAEHHQKHHFFQDNYLKNPLPRPMGSGLKLSACHKNGDSLPVDISLCPIKDKDSAMIAIVIRDIREHRSMEEKLYFLAYHDHLTGLMNTEALYKALDEHIIKKSTFAIFLIDIDDFKKVNDSFGHAIGNQLLVAFCNRLKIIFSKDEIIARIGGDEFSCVMTLHRFEEAQSTAKIMLQQLSLPYVLGDATINLSVSIGISLFPKDATESRLLLAQADQAMYRVKKQGKNNFSF